MYLSAKPKTAEEKLVKAIKETNQAEITRIIPKILPVSAKLIVPGGKQAIHIACDFQQKEILEELLKLGADVNATTDRGFIALHRAAQLGNVDILLLLIKAGSNINAVTDNSLGTTPLQEAAHNGHLDACNVLIAVGADINYQEKKFGLTAAGLAKLKGHEHVVIGLMGYKKAFITRVTNEINTYKNIFQTGSSADKYWKQLNDLTFDETNPDDYFKKLGPALNSGHEAAKPHVQTMRSHIITYMKQYNTDKALENKIRLILPLGTSLHTSDTIEMNSATNEPTAIALLITAIKEFSIPKAKAALDRNVGINEILDKENNTPLLLTIKVGGGFNLKDEAFKLAIYFIQHAANPTFEDINEKSVFDYVSSEIGSQFLSEVAKASKARALRKETSKDLDELQNYTKLNMSLWMPKSNGLKSQGAIKELLAMPCNLEEKNSNGDTPLLQAVKNKGTFKALLKLIQAGANLDAKTKAGKTILTLITENSKLNAKQKGLVDQAIVATRKSIKTKKSLITAVTEGFYNLAEGALDRGENINQLTHPNDETPLMLALRNKNFIIAKLLVDHHADITIKNKHGDTVFQIVKEYDISEKVIEIIFKTGMIKSNKEENELEENNQHAHLSQMWKAAKDIPDPTEEKPVDALLENSKMSKQNQ